MRLAFIAYRGNMHCGGQGVYLWFLVRELARMGHEVDVFVGPPYPDPMPFARRVVQLENEQFWAKWFLKDRAAFLPRGAPLRLLHPLNFYELAASRLGFLPEPFAFSLRAFRAIAAQLAEGRRYDLVHDVQCLGWGTLGIRALGMPVVTTVHHPLSVDRRASFVRDQTLREAIGTMTFYPIGMQAFVARRLERVFTSSQASATEIERDFRVRPERLRMVANGVDTELFSPDPSVPKSATEVLCLGRAADPNKGVRVLIEALPHLPESTTVTLVDDDSPGNPGRRRAQELGCGDRLRLVGRVSSEELVRLYRRATVVAVPSRYEGFGLPAAEAMACGTPVVATRAGALAEVVGPAGVLVPRDRPRALAEGLRSLLLDPERCALLAEQGRKRIESIYAWPRVAAATAQVYAEVLACRRGLPARTTTSESPGARRASQSQASSVA